MKVDLTGGRFMGMSTKDYEAQTKTGRFRILETADVALLMDGFEGDDCQWHILEFDDNNNLIRVVGSDGGEPEDQSLVRDWQWVANELNRVAETALTDARTLRLQAKTFARAADTEKAEAKHWREYAEKLEAAIRECEGDGGCGATKALREKVRYGTHCLHPARCNPDKGAEGCVCACAGCRRSNGD